MQKSLSHLLNGVIDIASNFIPFLWLVFSFIFWKSNRWASIYSLTLLAIFVIFLFYVGFSSEEKTRRPRFIFFGLSIICSIPHFMILIANQTRGQ